MEATKTKLVNYSVKNGVAWLELTDPPANTYTHEMMPFPHVDLGLYPRRRKMSWCSIGVPIAGSSSELHSLNCLANGCIHRLWTALSTLCGRWLVWIWVLLREVKM